ncbi:3-phosphoserine/phosphohydroxythreonine transaminase [Candidatus Nitrosacidococcus sp. I8]|uniref:3-phosphoserine/phosphohydroxythreonine transaminase n=1 Tax=Candidatus Nitrosacidococcus sp. I8 TaxID=2942908 RepID=UPI0022261DEF|nr:3-phosphoserine/phosphohydroxythreonine transaminase [Candidatus Nitrosacidococcus sp. I8]CAH9018387.1 Phosphoserine aminotransferase [Candidatus Nitrosacidococcus sp. I8]
MARIYNFSPGPAMLPSEVMEQARDEILNWHNTGMSVMEMSHRGKQYTEIAEESEADFRELLSIPSNYKVLFLQGGAATQFAMVPMNLLRGKKKADYLCTGHWSEKAIEEGQKFCEVNVVANTKSTKFTHIPAQQDWNLNSEAAYFHYTPNETIAGVEFHWIPEIGNVPLAVDMSSTLLSRPIDVSKFGVIYAGAQKNIGCAGLTIIIVREDLIGQTLSGTPTMFDYQIHAKNNSMYNTPSTYPWYISSLVFKWLKKKGGLAAMAEINHKKAETLYGFVDNSSFYTNPVDPTCRSWMNVPFILANSNLDEQFLNQAKQAGLANLKGHRSVGGMRASIYNAMPQEGINALVDFMKEFERTKG